MKLVFVVLLSVALVPQMIQAAVVTVDVTIQAVNPQARGITVVYKTELGEKTIELDVSRKAEITLNGKEGPLNSLGPGLNAKVSYDKDLAVVTKIEATGAVVKRPELVAVPELNDGGMNWLNSVSEDGLTVYWVHTDPKKLSMIWTARRADPQSPFTDKKELFQGGSVAVSADGLEMILGAKRSDGQKGASLYVATRNAPDKPFGQPAGIPELVKFFNGEPCLSSDCLTLYASRPGPQEQDSTSFVYSTRKDRSSAWSNPKPLYNITVEYGHLGDPFVTPDGLNLLCTHIFPNQTDEKGNLMIWSRSATGGPFPKGKYIAVDNLPPLVGACPKYVAATNELFFSRYSFENKKRAGRSEIWVVKNFKLPVETQ